MPESQGTKTSGGDLPPEVIRQITEEVYRKLLEEARIEYERERNLRRPLRQRYGGQ